jgi:hypothetical protein
MSRTRVLIVVGLVSCSASTGVVDHGTRATRTSSSATAAAEPTELEIVDDVKRVMPTSGVRWTESYVLSYAAAGGGRFSGQVSARWRSPSPSSGDEPASAIASRVWATLEARGCKLVHEAPLQTDNPGEARQYACEHGPATATWRRLRTPSGALADDVFDLGVATGRKRLDELGSFLRSTILSGVFASVSKPALARLDLITASPDYAEARFNGASADEADELESLSTQARASSHRADQGGRRYQVNIWRESGAR